jgi:flagellar hook protein FlgE
MPFDIALSGLNAAQTDLDVIANNIANSNTNGFKSSRAEFADVYAVSQIGTANNATGKGVRVASVSTQHSQGDINFTENNLDLAVSGKGFFRLDTQGSIAYSRAGAFQVDKDGFVVNSTGAQLTGFQADTSGNLTGAIGSLQLEFADSNPQATATLNLGANLDALETVPAAFNVTDPSTYNHSTSTTVFDSLGASHIASMFFRKDGVNAWESFTYVDGAEVNPAGGNALAFNSSGGISGASSFNTVSFNPGSGAANMTINFDFANLTQFGGSFGISELSQDGFSTGLLNGVDFDESGVLFARYSNGRTTTLGQVALANFANNQGLQENGDSTYTESFASGAAIVAAPGSTNLGLIQSGALEQSNVDLTKELVDLITAQRTFQANAKVITTAGDVTQTIINIGR